MKTKVYFFALTVMSAFGLQAQTIMNIHQSNGTVLQIPLNTIDSITYTILNPGNLATLTTTAASSITDISAVSGGNITNDGGTLITQRGICYSTNPSPTTANTVIISGSGTGSFTSNLTGLSASTTYYVRAYATNSAGTAYGNEVSFTTPAESGSITALNCNSANNSGTLTAGIEAVGVSSIVPYTGGNGGVYSGQTVLSEGVTGLTATLTAGTLTNGSGSITYIITGTPSSAGTAYFALNIGGQNCFLNRTVGIVSNPGAGVTFNGYTYSSVVLGNGQEWMAENLRTTAYANGDPIPNVTDGLQWCNLTTGAWAHYNDDSQYENPYGKLYNWYTVADPRNVCPVGWHVPSESEWNNFIYYLDPEMGGSFGDVAGGKMKSLGTQYWQIPNTSATNESGFSGLPGGVFSNNCLAPDYATFMNFSAEGFWWSSSEESPSSAWAYKLSYDSGTVTWGNYNKGNGFSIRCLKD